MEKRLKSYLEYMRKFVSKDHSMNEYVYAYNDLMIQIQFFQHERLIHLMVTLAFAIFTICGVVACSFIISVPLVLLTLLFLGLLIPYVRHYYILENGVQELYKRYDHIYEKINKEKDGE